MNDAWNSEERYSIIVNIVLFICLLVILNFALSQKNLLLIAVGAGGLGGFIHEIAQSQGKIIFIKKYEDGLYLGSISGIILGVIAGVLILQNPIDTETTTKAIVDAFMAGLALKGITEAASSKPQGEGK